MSLKIGEIIGLAIGGAMIMRVDVVVGFAELFLW